MIIEGWGSFSAMHIVIIELVRSRMFPKMASKLTVLALFCLSLAATVGGERQMQLILEDDFNQFNLSLWKHEITLGGGGNWEFEYYNNNRTNSYVRDGILYINPTLLADEIGEENVIGNNYMLDIWGSTPADRCTGNAFYGCSRTAGAGGNILNPIKSARIRTAESFSFTYGKVEVRAKLPKGDWLWPAIWMLPRDDQYGNWPQSGEIDIMESRGNDPSYPPGGYDNYGSTLHWGPVYTQDKWPLTHTEKKGVDLTADFHVYGLIWNETYIGTYFDNETNIVLNFPITKSFWQLGGWTTPPWNNPWEGGNRNAPFDRRFFFVIDLACGGTGGYFPDNQGNKPWSNEDPHAINAFYKAKPQWYPTWTQPMAIDYVRVWQYVDDTPRPGRKEIGEKARKRETRMRQMEKERRLKRKFERTFTFHI